MKVRQRIVCLLTTLAVAWTALWPLVTSARLLASDQPMELCHQAGGQVAPDQSPQQPGAPQKGKQHCPLCVMAFFAAFTAPVVAPAPAHFADGAALDTYCAPLPAGVEVQLPQSRAPPATA